MLCDVRAPPAVPKNGPRRLKNEQHFWPRFRARKLFVRPPRPPRFRKIRPRSSEKSSPRGWKMRSFSGSVSALEN